jgi:uncharacterized protein (TIGR03083 family)
MIARMRYEDHLEAVEREVAALVDVFAAVTIDAQVPTCPDWTVADLADHVGGFTGFWSHVLCEGTGRPKTGFTQRPAGGDVGAWYAGLGASLITELGATAPEQRVWTWAPGRNDASFVARRCAHELAVHRFDAQAALGATAPIDGALAVDGIEEIFVMIDAWKANGHPESGAGERQTLHVHATDRDAEWMLTLTRDGLDVRREHAKGDLALRGAVSDLELLLYGRPPVGSVGRFGEQAVLDAWYRAFKFG